MEALVTPLSCRVPPSSTMKLPPAWPLAKLLITATPPSTMKVPLFTKVPVSKVLNVPDTSIVPLFLNVAPAMIVRVVSVRRPVAPKSMSPKLTTSPTAERKARDAVCRSSVSASITWLLKTMKMSEPVDRRLKL